MNMFVGVEGRLFECIPGQIHVQPMVSLSMVNTYQQEILIEPAWAFNFNMEFCQIYTISSHSTPLLHTMRADRIVALPLNMLSRFMVLFSLYFKPFFANKGNKCVNLSFF